MSGCTRLFHFGILLLVLSCPLTAAVYTLTAQVQVTKAQIYLDDILDPASLLALGHHEQRIPVQRLAGAGPYVISSKRVYQLLRQHGLFKAGDRVHGQASVSWKQLEITPAQLAAGVRSDILDRLKDYAAAEAIDISVLQEGAALSVNDETDNPHSLLFEPLQSALFGQVPYRARVMRGQRELGRTLLIMKVAVRKIVTVARRDMQRGHVVSVGDLRQQEIVLNHRRQAEGLVAFEDLVGCVALQTLRADLPIRSFLVRRPYAVRGGQLVDMVYQHPEFQISLRGRANGSAAIGELVSVRGVDGGQLVKGRVIAEGQVLIQ